MEFVSERFCLDVPAGTDLEAVYQQFRSCWADMVMDEKRLVARSATAPDGAARLVVSGEPLAGTEWVLTRLLSEFGHGRAAVATDWGEHGARWTVLGATGGACRVVQRTTVLGAAESEHNSVIDRDWDGVDPRAKDKRGIGALSAVARKYTVDIADLVAVEVDVEGIHRRRRAAGLDAFPWWDVLRLPGSVAGRMGVVVGRAQFTAVEAEHPRARLA